MAHQCYLASAPSPYMYSTTPNDHIEQIGHYASFDTHISLEAAGNVQHTCYSSNVIGAHMDVKIRDDNEIKINRPGS